MSEGTGTPEFAVTEVYFGGAVITFVSIPPNMSPPYQILNTHFLNVPFIGFSVFFFFRVFKGIQKSVFLLIGCSGFLPTCL